jgi:hypothetical protein
MSRIVCQEQDVAYLHRSTELVNVSFVLKTEYSRVSCGVLVKIETELC